MVKIEKSWSRYLGEEFNKPYFANLAKAVHEEYRRGTCYPPGELVFNAFNLCPFDEVKVVIIGQDPYHGPGQAMGLSFSVPEGVPIPQNGNLTRWAKQGVLLLNATLTVRAHEANSHQQLGWTTFTDAAIKALNDHKNGLVFMLWGRFAQGKKYLIDHNKHCILESVHPSPRSARLGGWFGNHHFSQCNAYLRERGEQEIAW